MVISGQSFRALLRTGAFQLTVSYALVFCLSAVVLAAVFYWFTVGLLVRESDATVKAEITGLAEQYAEHGLARLSEVIQSRVANEASRDMIYAFATPDFRIVAGNIERWPKVTPDSSGWLEFSHRTNAGRSVPARARAYVLSGGLRLLVGRNVEVLDHLRSVMNGALLAVIAVVLVLAIAGGLFMSARVQRRVAQFTAVTAGVIDGNLHRRLTLREPGDEFDTLARHLNAMLDRIESLIATIKHVSDDIAHDLRTPLTRLRNRLESLTRGAPEAARGGLEEAIEEADRLLSTFASLLRIGRLEGGSVELDAQSLDLAALCADAADMYEELAREHGVDIELDTTAAATARGDRDLLFQALTNLLDNAIKFAPAGTTIELVARREEKSARLEVCDRGRGIAVAETEAATERFVRLGASPETPGAGLGLSLVKAIAELHGGRVVLEDNAPGLRAGIVIPLSG